MFVAHILDAVLNGDFSGLLASGLSSLFEGAQNALNDVMRDLDPRNEVVKELKDFAKGLFDDYMPGADEAERIEHDINQLLKDVQSEGNVFDNISNAVQNALGSGVIQPQGDGGLGQTFEDFSQGSQAPVAVDVGGVPGISVDAAGTPRSGGDSAGGVGVGGGGGGSSPTPLGGSGSSGTPAAPGASGTQAPTASDLGIDPNSGAYIEYQPNQGQVQITYPDGTTETRPWPSH